MLTPPVQPMPAGEPAPSGASCPLAGQAVATRGAAPSLDCARDLLESLGMVVAAQPRGPVLGLLDASTDHDPISPAAVGGTGRRRGESQLAAGSVNVAERPVVRVSPNPAAADWAWSGAMALTGPPDGPPALSPGAPASALSGALAVFELLSNCRITGYETASQLPGSWLLGERAALAGLSRQAPRSVGGAFRALRAADGWLGLSLARPDDIDLLPALIGGELTGAGPGQDPWRAVAAWLAGCELETAISRARLLALPAAAMPPEPVPVRRPPVLSTPGGLRRNDRDRPLVVDLTSLWAGPLCAHLLGLIGARVVKVESRGRPDGARTGTPAFFDLLHAGHLSVALDFASPDDIAALRHLLAQADVILEASRPRALQQLGIDAAEYVAGGAVWASITAYGRTGQDAQRIGFGDDVAAAAGLVARCGLVPYPVGDAIADPLAGAYAAAAVAAGLLSSRGQLLDVSMFDVAVAAAVCASDRDAEVLATAPGRWAVRTADLTTPVRAPRARQPAAAAAQLGQHTRTVLGDLTRWPPGPGPG
jgi:crotonobetainyl-CoA:carnitine CoA-transferase CaiB-like acyl-CoA transferase